MVNLLLPWGRYVPWPQIVPAAGSLPALYFDGETLHSLVAWVANLVVLYGVWLEARAAFWKGPELGDRPKPDARTSARASIGDEPDASKVDGQHGAGLLCFGLLAEATMTTPLPHWLATNGAIEWLAFMRNLFFLAAVFTVCASHLARLKELAVPKLPKVEPAPSARSGAPFPMLAFLTVVGVGFYAIDRWKAHPKHRLPLVSRRRRPLP